jgi:D-3-phosphoglycerate dehydrogenase / 2-oxoglutarate reductase
MEPSISFNQQNYDAIIVRSDTKITSDVLASGASGKLKVVGRAGVGVDNIDIDAATNNNVVVLKWVLSNQKTF